ncbi:restriction endonuclease subunit S [Stutzerimonas kunmingensis]|uniref:restriction endonuclease subunit S n=1 Tax=Stutzerimonas kunmingensis TaxID=1211807 RepID=UPI000CE2DA6E|nr:restriction endonuclease subunit S [Stutzerimonas kunmingensis]
MSSEIDPAFVTVSCDKYCLRVADGTHDSPKQTSVGKLLVTSKNVKGGGLFLDSAYFISEEDYLDINRRSKVDQWDLLLTMIGTVGEICIVDQEDPIFAIKNVGLLKCGTEIRAKWLYYFLRSPQGQQLIEQRKKGSTQQYISLTEVRNLPVSYPASKTDMRDAVSVLGALDDRITLLRETNTTLEAIAQALFKSWFVDFDPVRAKAEGRQPEGVDATTAALFPDSFEESELGLVPKGWRVGKVEDLMELAYGKALKATDRNDGPVPVYGSGGITGYHDQALVAGPSIIVGRKGTVGSLYWEDQPFFPIDTVFYVKTDQPLTYCYYLLKTLGLEDMNTDGAVPGLNRGNAYRLPVVIPDTSVLNAFNEITAALRVTMFANEQQAQTLTQLRDTLLPRLISGQLRLPEAEALVAEAV